jgi:maleate isomerase
VVTNGRLAAHTPRTRIGFVVPSSNTTIETEVPEMLRWREELHPDERFTFHSSRVRMTRVTAEELVAMNSHMERATRELADADPAAVASACLVAIMAQGPSHHEKVESDMASWLGEGTGVTTSAGALVGALDELGAERIAVLTPYTRDLTDLVCGYLESAGVEVVDKHSLEVADNKAVARLDQAALSEHWRKLDLAGCDALVLSACVQMPSLQVLAQVEQQAGIPVLSASTATAYQLLKLVGLEPVVPDAGWLLSPDRLAGRGSGAL